MKLIERTRSDNLYGGKSIRYNSDTLITDDAFRKAVLAMGGHVYNVCCSVIHGSYENRRDANTKQIFNGNTWLMFSGASNRICEGLMREFLEKYDAHHA